MRSNTFVLLHIPRLLLLAATLMLGSFILSVGPVAAEDQSCQGVFARLTLRGQFEATVREGPDAGFSVTGTITMHVEGSGSFAGTLTQPDGTVVAFSGSINGREIQYRFDLGNGAAIFGSGVLPDPCTDPVTGLLLGPNPPDRGDWGIVWGS